MSWFYNHITKALADEVGWSRERVKDYAALKKICPEAWEIVGATLREFSLVPSDGAAPTNGATAPLFEMYRWHRKMERCQMLAPRCRSQSGASATLRPRARGSCGQSCGAIRSSQPGK